MACFSSAAGVGEDTLRFREAGLSSMIESLPFGILVSDREGRCVYSNAAYENLSGQPADWSRERHWTVAIHPEDRPAALASRNTDAVEQMHPQEVRLLRPDGGVRWVRLHMSALGDGSFMHTLEDVTAGREAEQELRATQETLLEQNERARVTLDSIGDAVLTTDHDGNVLYLNRVGEILSGWSLDRALGRPLAEVFHIVDGETRRRAEDPARQAIAEDRIVGLAIGCVLLRPDGTELKIEDSAAPIHDRQGTVSGAVIVFREASQSRSVTERMAYLAQHDFLTGLPNRLLLRERLDQAIGLARRHSKAVGILYVDLDNFKQVNDLLGHETGDRLLRAVANRLLSSVRATDSVCREGGDEFVILLNELERAADASDVAEKLHAALEVPLQADGHELRVTASIGISLFPQDGDCASAMLRKADMAMYRAKTDAPGTYRYSSAGTNMSPLRRRLSRDANRQAQSGEPAAGVPDRHSPDPNLVSHR